MNKTLNYITYQTFPANTANSLQTAKQLDALVKSGLKVNLIFPLREKTSSDNLNAYKKKYAVSENITLRGINHPYPFGKLKIIEPLLYHMSHFLWARKISKSYKYENEKNNFFMTRSDWILYFLAKKNLNIVFECHQYSKLRNWIFNKVGSRNNVKVVFLNTYIRESFDTTINNTLLLHSSVDLSEFPKEINQLNKKKKIIFLGNLLRFGKNRGINSLLNSFNDPIFNEYELIIAGGPNEVADELRSTNTQSNVKILGTIERKEVIKHLCEAEIGILMNSNDTHSQQYTSPLKYFEYLASELKIVGTNFPSHKALPYSEQIEFFEYGNENSLKEAIKACIAKDFLDIDKQSISTETRAKKIMNFFNS
jgi:hypothetical protein